MVYYFTIPSIPHIEFVEWTDEKCRFHYSDANVGHWWTTTRLHVIKKMKDGEWKVLIR